MTSRELKDALQPVRREIDNLLTITGYKDTGEIHISDAQAQDLFADEAKLFIYKVEAAAERLDYLTHEPTEQGRLTRNERGRYQLGERELTHGNRIEALIYDESKQSSHWILATIESNGAGYYLKGHNNIDLEGLPARIRY